jgi:hypothetical protein
MRGLIKVGLSAVCGGVVLAACATQPVTPVQPAQELLGTKLAGVHVESGLEWSECIEPDGDTVYRINGTELLGKLRISSEGLACFQFDGVENCYSVERRAGGYSLTLPGDESSRFNVNSVERGVKMCAPGELPA